MITLARKRTRPRRPLKPRYPRRIERRYTIMLTQWTSSMTGIVKEKFLNILPVLMHQAHPYDHARLDWSATIENMIREMDGKFQVSSKDPEQIAKDIISYAGIDLARCLAASMEAQPMFFTPWEGEYVDSFIHENVSLIKSIKSEHLKAVEGILQRGIRSHEPVSSIAHRIENAGGVSQRRAAMIARDQVGRFFGQVNKKLQVDSGIEKYIWYTAMDERVRPTHAANEGKIFTWKEGSPIGHPGEEHFCRCTAGAVF